MYYTYIYSDIDGTPIYVGKGKNNRFEKHKHADTHLGNVIRKREREGHMLVPIITPHESEPEALAREKELIALYGRADLGLGTLFNLTDGGDGPGGVIRSDEFKQNLSNFHTGKKKSAETRAKMSAHAKTRVCSEETKEKIRRKRLGTTQSEETKRKRTRTMLRIYAEKRALRNVTPDN